MRTNADVTLYNKYIDSATRSEKWLRTQIKRVAWDNRKASNTLAVGGRIKADQATVYIPLSHGTNYLSPKDWQAETAKSDYWTLQDGDVIVRGLTVDEITVSYTMTDLKKSHDDVLTISSVDTMDNGSKSLQHWKVSAG